MTSYSPSQSDANEFPLAEPDSFPLGPNPADQVHWVDQDSEDPTFPEGNWSGHTAEVADVLRPGSRYQVKYEATYWTAVPVEPETDFQLGDRVAVLGRKGNELLIGPLPHPSNSTAVEESL